MANYSGILIVDSVLAILVYLDARRFDWTGDGMSKPWHWSIGMFIVWPAVLVLYLMRRRKRPRLGVTR